MSPADNFGLSGFHVHILEGRYLEAAAVADEGLGYLLASMTDWPLCYGSPEAVRGWEGHQGDGVVKVLKVQRRAS